MRGADEEWVEAAMADDSLVVELLVRLHRAQPRKEALLPMKWTVRQRRSKAISVSHKPRKKPMHRASPTTPLSWSDATGATVSGGAGGGGSEESTRLLPFKLEGSKVNIDSEKTASKRSRKKKTLAELKDEQILLMKERRELEREIAAAHENLERQRVTNATLKRMKIEQLSHMDRELTSVTEEATSARHKPESTSAHHSPHIGQPSVSCNNATLQSATSNTHPEKHTDAPSDPEFILPDLNIPFDEPSSDVISGVS